MKKLCVAICMSATLLLACATGGGGKGSVNINDVQILRSGSYEGTQLKRKNTNTSHGKENVYEDFEFVSDSNRVPAVLGNRFGFRIVLRGEPDGKIIKVKVKRHHPPMMNPHKNKVISLSEYTRKFKINKAQVIGYGFDEEWELVEGDHRFELFYGGRLLTEKTFTVYRP